MEKSSAIRVAFFFRVHNTRTRFFQKKDAPRGLPKGRPHGASKISTFLSIQFFWRKSLSRDIKISTSCLSHILSLSAFPILCPVECVYPPDQRKRGVSATYFLNAMCGWTGGDSAGSQS